MSGRRPWPDHDWVILPIIDFDFPLYQRPQHFAVGFARSGREVLYLRTTSRPAALTDDTPVDDTLTTGASGVWTAQLDGPPGFSINMTPIDQALADEFVVQIRRWLRRVGSLRVAVLVQQPGWLPVAKLLREQTGAPIVFDYLDDFRGFGDQYLSHEILRTTEHALIETADLVVTPAASLLVRASGLNANAILVPNACDFEHFAPQAPPHPRIEALDGPIVGYWGAISHWFDRELLVDAARRLPRHHFVLAGYSWIDLAALEAEPNIHLLGPVAYADLPSLLAGCDAALIPFRLSELTRHTNPVKLFEYFARGVPVVARPIPEIEDFRELFYPYTDADSLVSSIEAAVGERAADLRERRVAIAKHNTWARRIRVVEDAVAALRPSSALPSVSLVMVSHNTCDLTRAAIESVIRQTQYPDVELIVVDNASSDGSPRMIEGYAAEYDRVTAVCRDTNDSFARACNTGVRLTRGAYLGILNSDIEVTPGWLDRLLWHLEDDPAIGMVGPVTDFAANEARVEVTFDSHAEMVRCALERRASRAFHRFPVPMLALFCVLFRRSLVDEIGLIDERFETGMFEDDDYCWRIRRAGYVLAVAEDVFVHHVGKASFSQLADEAYAEVWRNNKARFEEKWDMAWRPQRSRGDDGRVVAEDAVESPHGDE